MAIEIVPWHVFFELIRKQPKAGLEEWLSQWCFNEEGAFLLRALAKSEGDLRPTLAKVLAELSFLQLANRRTFH
jgi:hypothetical protein